GRYRGCRPAWTGWGRASPRALRPQPDHARRGQRPAAASPQPLGQPPSAPLPSPPTASTPTARNQADDRIRSARNTSACTPRGTRVVRARWRQHPVLASERTATGAAPRHSPVLAAERTATAGPRRQRPVLAAERTATVDTRRQSPVLAPE